jgi:hypothetical protein
MPHDINEPANITKWIHVPISDVYMVQAHFTALHKSPYALHATNNPYFSVPHGCIGIFSPTTPHTTQHASPHNTHTPYHHTTRTPHTTTHHTTHHTTPPTHHTRIHPTTQQNTSQQQNTFQQHNAHLTVEWTRQSGEQQ